MTPSTSPISGIPQGEQSKIPQDTTVEDKPGATSEEYIAIPLILYQTLIADIQQLSQQNASLEINNHVLCSQLTHVTQTLESRKRQNHSLHRVIEQQQKILQDQEQRREARSH